MNTAYLTHPSCLEHETGEGHPECPARISAIEDQLVASGLLDFLSQYNAPKANKEQLTRVHTLDYVEWVISQAPQSELIHLDDDTVMSPYSLNAALHAAGAAIKAVDLVMSAQVKNAFCNIRPPGHHVGRSGASGFCIFNNVAIAAAHAIEHHGLLRVAIADFDVHHGNGTEDIFHDDPRVMLCSTFQHPFYPNCGADSGNDHIINVPLAVGSSGIEFRTAVNEQWLPALDDFKPQLILVSAGFDAHREDDMGGLALQEADYFWVTEKLKHIAKQHANDRIVSTLEGGYALHALGRSVMNHIKALSGV